MVLNLRCIFLAVAIGTGGDNLEQRIYEHTLLFLVSYVLLELTSEIQSRFHYSGDVQAGRLSEGRDVSGNAVRGMQARGVKFSLSVIHS